jgi:hypothetical protein
MSAVEDSADQGFQPSGPVMDEHVRSLLRENGLRCTAECLAVLALFVGGEAREGHGQGHGHPSAA